MKEKKSIFEWMYEKQTLELTNSDILDVLHAVLMYKSECLKKGNLNLYESMSNIYKNIEKQFKDY